MTARQLYENAIAELHEDYWRAMNILFDLLNKAYS